MKKSSTQKKKPDLNELAAAIVAEATGNKPAEEEPASEKNPAAVALGHLGGLKGGPARAKKLSAKKRKEIASKAARARWDRQRKD
jgi:hypothetical protein